MFEAAEVGAECSKEEFEAAVPQLRVDLVNAQFELGERDFSVLVQLAGNDRQGVEETFDLLHEWCDARQLDAHAFSEPSPEELERPRFWRYWRVLPADGRTGVFLGAWTHAALLEYVTSELDDHAFERRLAHIRSFEEDLTADGTLMLKFWMHVPVDVLEKRVRRAKKHPEELHHVEDRDHAIVEHWKQVRPLAERYLRETSTVAAPWTIVESTDDRHRSLTVGRALRDAIARRLEAPPPPKSPSPPAAAAPKKTVLDNVDLTATLAKKAYRESRDKLQGQLHRLSIKARKKGRSTVLVFEGWDAAGKGGTIRRLTRAMSARDYRVVSIAAPTEEERAHHYLWRFWRHLPRAGKVLIFDRSWYGRVLVERVEGFATEHEWGRAYEEINDFEAQLVEHGIGLRKFWLHIDEAEQMRRFEDRTRTPYKKYKITEEDFRNRAKRDAYVLAVEDMVARTSTEFAPWSLVPANDKRFARIEVLRQVCEAFERG